MRSPNFLHAIPKLLAILLLLTSPTSLSAQRADSRIVLGGPVSPDGKFAVQCDFPGTLRMENKGGSDGAGLCVSTSVEHCALWSNEPGVFGLQQKLTKEPGGSYPTRLAESMKKHCAGVQYTQYEGDKWEVVKAVLDSGRCVAITYGGSDGVIYNGQISHYVNLVGLSGIGKDDWAAIMDNNDVKGQVKGHKYLWLPFPEFAKRACTPSRGGRAVFWATWLERYGPPPLPTNSDGPVTPRQAVEEVTQFTSLVGDESTLAWWDHKGEGNHWFLYDGATLVGRADKKTRQYQAWIALGKVGGYWSAVTRNAPGDAPAMPGAATQPEQKTLPSGTKNYGMDWKPGESEQCLINGQPVPCKKLIDSIQAGQNPTIPPDAGQLHLTMRLPTKAECDRANTDWNTHPLLARFKGAVKFQCYDATSPVATITDPSLGFPALGVVLQTPANVGSAYGRVVAWQPQYEGPEQLAKALEEHGAVRRAPDPNFDPSKAPDLHGPAMIVNGDAVFYGAAAFFLFGLVGLGLVAAKRNSEGEGES